jgi:hypothetical protein
MLGYLEPGPVNQSLRAPQSEEDYVCDCGHANPFYPKACCVEGCLAAMCEECRPATSCEECTKYPCQLHIEQHGNWYRCTDCEEKVKAVAA